MVCIQRSERTSEGTIYDPIQCQKIEYNLSCCKRSVNKMTGNYISVSEFAKRSGRSRQYIYSLLDSKLSTFCKVDDNGKKTINEEALQVIEADAKSSIVCQDDSEQLEKIDKILNNLWLL